MRARLTRFKIQNDLLIVIVLTLLLIAVIVLFPSNWLRVVLGLPFLLFFPGYALMAALFPRKTDLGGIERLALSLGLSIAVVPLIGLALNYTAWGIRLYPILICVSAFTIVASSIAWWKRRRFPDAELIKLSFHPALTGWKHETGLDRVLSVLLAISIVAALGTLGYAVAKPKVGERFTEFYFGGELDKPGTLPSRLSLGSTANVSLAIVNHEHEEAVYRIEVRENTSNVSGQPGALLKAVGPVTLQHEQTWQQSVDFAPVSAGENQKLEFLLFKGAERTPYRELHLWVDVVE